MLARARQRLRRARLRRRCWCAATSGICRFAAGRGSILVMAPYGMLQSLTRERDLRPTLDGRRRACCRAAACSRSISCPTCRAGPNTIAASACRARAGRGTIRLTESVRQDRRGALTIFDQEFIERRGDGASARRFSLTFRTISVPQMRQRLERAGFRIDAVLGDYDGGPFDARADVWIILAQTKRCGQVGSARA